MSLQQEVIDGWSVSAGIYRRSYYNQLFIDNILQSQSDYTPFTITGPSDPRLPNGGGEAITLYNLNPNVFGLEKEFLTNSDINDKTYTGFEMVVDGRLPNGGFIGGSFTTGRLAVNSCDVDNPNNLRFCDYTPPFTTLAKMHASYPLPGDWIVSGFLQAQPGRDVDANYNVTRLPDGTTLTGGARISFDLLEPETERLPYGTKLDLRIMKRFTMGGSTVTPILDIYNVFNSNTDLRWNGTFGSRWRQIQRIMAPRLLRLALEVNW